MFGGLEPFRLQRKDESVFKMPQLWTGCISVCLKGEEFSGSPRIYRQIQVQHGEISGLWPQSGFWLSSDGRLLLLALTLPTAASGAAQQYWRPPGYLPGVVTCSNTLSLSHCASWTLKLLWNIGNVEKPEGLVWPLPVKWSRGKYSSFV